MFALTPPQCPSSSFPPPSRPSLLERSAALSHRLNRNLVPNVGSYFQIHIILQFPTFLKFPRHTLKFYKIIFKPIHGFNYSVAPRAVAAQCHCAALPSTACRAFVMPSARRRAELQLARTPQSCSSPAHCYAKFVAYCSCRVASRSMHPLCAQPPDCRQDNVLEQAVVVASQLRL